MPPAQSPDSPNGFFSVEEDRETLEAAVEEQPYLDRLDALRPADSPSDALHALLQLGTEWLGVEHGHLARIDLADGTHTIEDVSGPHPTVSQGDTRDLSRTFCRSVLANNAALAIENAAEEGWDTDPAYEEFGVSTYVGAKVVAGTDFYGTLCFVDREARATPLSEAETAAMELLSRTAGQLLATDRSASPTPSQLEALFAQSPTMINVHDAEGTLIAPNPHLCEKTGYTEEELTGMKVWEIDQDVTPEEARAFWSDLEPGDRSRWEGTYRRKDGTTFPVEVDLRRLDGEGPPRFVVTSRDITERREAEEAQKQSKELHRETLRNITDAVFLTRDDGTFVYVCPNVNHIFGYDQQAAEELGSISALLGGDPFDEHDFNGEQEITNVEWSITDTDGHAHDLLINIRPVAIQDGTRMYTCRDVTERKERERQLDAVFNQTYQFTGLLDPDGTLIKANDTALQFGGLEKEDVIGQPVWETDWFQTGSETKERLRASVQRAADGEFVRYEETVQGAEETRIIDFSLRPVVGEDGTVEHIIPEGRDITERTEADRELRETKTLLEKTFESLSEVVVVVDPSEREIIACNAAVEEVFGYEKEELIGESTQKLHKSPEAYERFATIGEPILEEEGLFRHEYQMQRKDGQLIETEHVVTPLQDENWPGGVVSVIRDITEQKTTERELQEERDLLNRILETSPAAIAVLNTDGEFLEVSNRAEAVLGLERDEVTDRTYDDPAWDIRGPEGGPMPDEDLPFARVMKTDEPVYNVEHQIVWPDGTHRLLSVSGAPLHSPDGELDGVVFHIDDITEQRAAKQALQDERDRFATLFHNLPTPVVRGRPDSEGRVRVEAVNERFETVFGYKEDAIRDDNLQDLVVPDEEKDTSESMRQRLLEGTSVNREVRRRAADGLRDFRVQVALRKGKSGPTEGFAIYTDITERKERERALARRQALLEAQAESTIDGLLAIDSNREVVFYNEQFLKVWDIPESLVDKDRDGTLNEALLEAASDLLPNLDAFRRKLEYLYDHPSEESRDLIDLTDGRCLDRYSAPIVGDDGERFGRLWVFRDVTRQRRMLERLLEVQEEERRRIDQEIHDEMGGLLTSLQLTVDLARRATGTDEGSTEHFDQLEELVSDLSTVSRTISRKLYPSDLPEFGLADAFSSLVGKMERERNLEVDLYSEIEPDDRFPALIERTAYWIVQEALINVARHDETDGAQVIVNNRKKQLYLHVFDERATFSSSAPNTEKRFRFEAIQRRVEWLDGEVRIDTIPGEGTRFSVILPVRLPFPEK